MAGAEVGILPADLPYRLVAGERVSLAQVARVRSDTLAVDRQLPRIAYGERFDFDTTQAAP